MAEGVFHEVFTADEVARAAGVTRAAVQAWLDSGEIRPIADSRFIAAADAIRLGRAVRRETPGLALVPVATAPLFANVADASGFAARRPGVHALGGIL